MKQISLKKMTCIKMHRSHHYHSSSFIKFVARLQRTFSSKTLKSSTVIIPQQSHPRISSFQLSEILYDPSRPIEYLSEIKDEDNSDSFSSLDSTNIDQEDQYNLSQMNISFHHHSPKKLVKLSNLSDTIRLHSTAIHDLSNV